MDGGPDVGAEIPTQARALVSEGTQVSPRLSASASTSPALATSAAPKLSSGDAPVDVKPISAIADAERAAAERGASQSKSPHPNAIESPHAKYGNEREERKQSPLLPPLPIANALTSDASGHAEAEVEVEEFTSAPVPQPKMHSTPAAAGVPSGGSGFGRSLSTVGRASGASAQRTRYECGHRQPDRNRTAVVAAPDESELSTIEKTRSVNYSRSHSQSVVDVVSRAPRPPQASRICSSGSTTNGKLYRQSLYCTSSEGWLLTCSS